ncbi:hypothetical protein Bca101_013552 [Brassica carinata]
MKSVTTKFKLLRPVLTSPCSYSSTDQTLLLNEFTRLCYQRDLPKALRAMDSLQSHGLWADSATYSELIKCCMSHRAVHEGNLVRRHLYFNGHQPMLFLANVLINMYVKFNLLTDAHNVFEKMPLRNVVSWTTMIAAYSKSKQQQKALELLVSMLREGVRPNVYTYSSVLRSCKEMSDVRMLHCGIIKDGLESDVFVRSALIDVFAKLEALKLFESMKASGTKPNYITIVGVLFACSHAGLLEDGWYYFRSMKKLYGIDPVREHYGCMIDLLGKAGKLDDAVKLLNEMEWEPDAVTWRTLLGACRVQGNMVLAEYVAKKIIELDPDDSGTYTVLSNIYANSQKWESVEEIRTQMRDRGIKKEPGCSWIEVNKKIHAFIIGDESHPLILEVNKKLNQLIDRMVGIGYVPETNFVLQDLEGEQMEDSLRHHSEKLALAFGLITLPVGKVIRIRKNLRICGDCHVFFKLASKLEKRSVVIRDPIRYHHFEDGKCSCGDYW